MTDVLESPIFLIESAKSNIQSLWDESKSFFEAQDGTVVIETDKKTGNKTYLFRPAKLPRRYRELTNNIFNNTRHAFDQLIESCGRAFIDASWDSGATNFPFRTCPNDVEGTLRSEPFCRFPQAVRDAILNIQPYPTGDGYEGGNDMLAAFSSVSGKHKHRLTAKTDFFITEAHLDRIKATHPVRVHTFPVWRKSKGYVEIGVVRAEGELHYDADISFDVVFDQARGMNGWRVCRTMDLIIQEFDKVLSAVQEELGGN